MAKVKMQPIINKLFENIKMRFIIQKFNTFDRIQLFSQPFQGDS